MIFAVDFDGTICESNYPLCGSPYFKRLKMLKKLQENGHKIILWTCRAGEALQNAVGWCEKNDVYFDSINEDLPEITKTEFGKNKSVKVYADFYLDDRNITWDFANTIKEVLTQESLQ